MFGAGRHLQVGSRRDRRTADCGRVGHQYRGDAGRIAVSLAGWLCVRRCKWAEFTSIRLSIAHGLESDRNCPVARYRHLAGDPSPARASPERMGLDRSRPTCRRRRGVPTRRPRPMDSGERASSETRHSCVGAPGACSVGQTGHRRQRSQPSRLAPPDRCWARTATRPPVDTARSASRSDPPRSARTGRAAAP